MKNKGVVLVIGLAVLGLVAYFIFMSVIRSAKNDPEALRNYLRTYAMSRFGNEAVFLPDTADWNQDGKPDLVAYLPAKKTSVTPEGFACDYFIIVGLKKKKPVALLDISPERMLNQAGDTLFPQEKARFGYRAQLSKVENRPMVEIMLLDSAGQPASNPMPLLFDAKSGLIQPPF